MPSPWFNGRRDHTAKTYDRGLHLWKPRPASPFRVSRRQRRHPRSSGGGNAIRLPAVSPRSGPAEATVPDPARHGVRQGEVCPSPKPESLDTKQKLLHAQTKTAGHNVAGAGRLGRSSRRDTTSVPRSGDRWIWINKPPEGLGGPHRANSVSTPSDPIIRCHKRDATMRVDEMASRAEFFPFPLSPYAVCSLLLDRIFYLTLFGLHATAYTAAHLFLTTTRFTPDSVEE